MKPVIDGVIILNPDGTVRSSDQKMVSYGAEAYPVLELHEIVAVCAIKGTANILQVTVDGGDIVSANLILGMQAKLDMPAQQTSPETSKDITITFSAFTDKDQKQ